MPSVYILALHSYTLVPLLYFLTWLSKKSIMIAALSTLQNHGHIVQNRLTPSPFGASLVAQMVNNPPAMQETWVKSLGPEHPLEEGMTPHSSILAWRIPWTEKPGGLQPVGLQSQT